jgi:hypothetical protein
VGSIRLPGSTDAANDAAAALALVTPAPEAALKEETKDQLAAHLENFRKHVRRDLSILSIAARVSEPATLERSSLSEPCTVRHLLTPRSASRGGLMTAGTRGCERSGAALGAYVGRRA